MPYQKPMSAVKGWGFTASCPPSLGRVRILVFFFFLCFVSDGRALLVNLYRKVVLHHFNFKQPVYDIKYSPDGRLVAVGPFMLSCLVCNLSVMSR